MGRTSIPQQIGKYRILGKLGEGGMGVVLAAEDPSLGRQVAIKILSDRAAANEAWLRRFEREARLLAALNHPNIATIHSIEKADVGMFLTLELIEGPTLSERIAAGALSVEETVSVTRQIASALEAAHARDIIHRDLKPGNVKVRADGTVKVLDFGLAKLVPPEEAAEERAEETALEPVTSSGVILGTPGYMSPEQINGLALDHRTDLWSFGCILFQCLTGRPPFGGSGSFEVLAATLQSEPRWKLLPESTPHGLVDLVRACLARDIDARPPAATDVRRLLDEEMHERTVSTRLARRGAPAPDAARRDRESIPNNLPVQRTSFVGREAELRRVFDFLESQRLVTLVGAGGCGKSRLAVEVGASRLDHFPDGVWFIELAAVENPDRVPHAVAATLRARPQRAETSSAAVARHLRDCQALVVMDNCEHLLAPAAELIELVLQECPRVRVLATSREVIGVAGEVAHRVPSLGLPEPGAEPSTGELSDFGAVQLFLDRARAASTAFELDVSNRAAIVEICRRLDGIPLAIELAAARAATMPVDELATRLDQRFRLLASRHRGTPPRHQTLGALVDWSYELLDDSERTLLQRMSVFAGGWTLNAAEHVGAGDGIESWEVLDLLSRLVEKSLVELGIGATGGAQRYSMLETVRHYARQRCMEAGGWERARERHSAYFAELATEAEPHLSGDEAGDWLTRLDRELANLHVATESSLEHEPHADAAAQITGGLWRFWQGRGYWSEARRHCAEVLAKSTHAATDATRVKVLRCASHLALHQGDFAEAEAGATACLAEFRALGDDEGVAWSLVTLGAVAMHRGDHDRAREHFEEGLSRFAAVHDERGVAFARYDLGLLAANRGDLGAARSHMEASLAIRRRLGDQREVAACLNNLGRVAWDGDEYANARALYTESLALFRELGSQVGIAVSLNNVGNTHWVEGELERARDCYNESLAVFRRLGNRNMVATCLHNLGNVARHGNRFDDALSHYQESLAIRHHANDQPGIAQSLEVLGLLAERLGALAWAATLLGAASAAWCATGEPPPTDEAAEQARVESELRSKLGTVEYERARQEGEQMSVGKVIERAIAPWPRS